MDKIIKIGVRILPRPEVLDTQGRAVASCLQQNQKALKLNEKELKNCRIGKYIELDFETQSKEEALLRAKEITDFVLHNPLIESYKLEVLSELKNE